MLFLLYCKRNVLVDENPVRSFHRSASLRDQHLQYICTLGYQKVGIYDYSLLTGGMGNTRIVAKTSLGARAVVKRYVILQGRVGCGGVVFSTRPCKCHIWRLTSKRILQFTKGNCV